MEESIQRIIEKVPYKVKLFVKNANEKTFLFSKSLEDVFSSASLIKVPILLSVFDYIERNTIPLNQILSFSSENRVDYSVITEQGLEEGTLYDLLVWMIITSDNTATNVLIDFLGIDYINRYIQKIGLTNTVLNRKMMDFTRLEMGFDNLTSAGDMAKLFSYIYGKELLSEKHSELVIDILSQQRIHDSLKRYLVDKVKIAHKTGSLDTVEHDVGIVFTEENDYIIGVFITEHTNNEEAKQLIGKVSKIVYRQIVQRGEKPL